MLPNNLGRYVQKPLHLQAKDRIIGHLNFAKAHEWRMADEIMSGVRGQFFPDQKEEDSGESTWISNTNILYNILDSAQTAMNPPNPTVSITPNTIFKDAGEKDRKTRLMQALTNYSLKQSDLHRITKLIIADISARGAGVYYTKWSVEKDCAIITRSPRASTFFDYSVENEDDIRYWVRSVAHTAEEFLELVRRGYYSVNRLEDISVTEFPRYHTTKSIAEVARAAQTPAWVEVWEYYDIYRDKVLHLHLGDSLLSGLSLGCTVLRAETLTYNPFNLVTFSPNGSDARGIPELSLVLGNQRCINYIKRVMMATAAASVPALVVNGNTVDAGEVAKMNKRKPGDAVILHTRSSRGNPITWGDVFFPTPDVELSPSQLQMYGMIQKEVAETSATASVTRASAEGMQATSATGVALMEGHMASRAGDRAGSVRTGQSKAATKVTQLNAQFVSKSKVLTLVGYDIQTEVTPEDVRGLDMTAEVVVYSGINQNRAVMREQLVTAIPMLLSLGADAKALGAAYLNAWEHPSLSPDKIFPDPLDTGAPGNITVPDAGAVTQVAKDTGAIPGGNVVNGLPPKAENIARDVAEGIG